MPVQYGRAHFNASKNVFRTRPHLHVDLDGNGNLHHIHDIGDYLKEQMLLPPPDGTPETNWTRTGIPHPTRPGRVIGIRRAMHLLRRYKKHKGNIDQETWKRIQKRYQAPYDTARVTGANPGLYRASTAAGVVATEAAAEKVAAAKEAVAEAVEEEVAAEDAAAEAGGKRKRRLRSLGTGVYRGIRDAGKRAGGDTSDEQFEAGMVSALSVSMTAVVVWLAQNVFKLF